MTRIPRIVTAIALLAGGLPAFAQSVSQPARRDTGAVMKDIEGLRQKLHEAKIEDAIEKPDLRATISPTVAPLLNQTLALVDELEQTGPAGKVTSTQLRPQINYLIALVGDSSSRATLEAEAKEDSPRGRAATAGLLMARWQDAHDKPDATNKVLDDTESAAKEKFKGSELLSTLTFYDDNPADNPAVAERVENLLLANASGNLREALKEQIADRRKLRAIENKPISIKAAKLDGATFNSEDWKGKVILVDFWATWCGPCKAELPHLKEVYDKYHDKGLEVLAVSCDSDKEALAGYLKDHPVPWPQLFDEKESPKGDGHPLAIAYGIHQIPRMFLIDKKGVVRSVDALEKYEEQIPKLLAE